ncbi:MAG: hypothetical protein ACI3Y0_10910 [Prevotella sp.]
MKLRYFYMFVAMVAMTLGFTACSPTDYELGAGSITSEDLAEGSAYTITHDSNNPNIVYLESKMGSSYTALWETPQGRFQSEKVTLKMPFAGEYSVQFGVETRSGVVYGNEAKFSIADICTDFITSEVWTLLAGGVGEEKTWVYDNGQYGYCSGELSYGDPSANTNLGLNNFTANWDPGAGHCGEDTMWDSYMTFNLKGAAGYTFYNSTTGTTQQGVFGLNEDTYVLSLTDADLMHPNSWDARLASWRMNLQIIELDENHLRVGYVRIPGNWGGEWVEVFNYVSKEYADNYVPPVDDNPAPTLAETWQSDISVLNKDYNSYRDIVWKLYDGDDAAAYFDLYGNLVDGIQAATDNGLDYKLELNSGAMTYVATTADGDSREGTYTLSDDGFMHFSNGLPTESAGKGGAALQTNADNSLRVLSYTMDGDELTDLWLGYDINDVHGNRYRYQAFHFVPTVKGASNVEEWKAGMHYFNTGWTFFDSNTVKVTGDGTYTFKITGADSEPYGIYLDVVKILSKYPNFNMTITDMRVDGKSIDFDDSQIERCTGDEKDAAGNAITARRYILNPWNPSNYFMANGYGVLAFSSSLEVDMKIEYETGTPFLPAEEAAKKVTSPWAKYAKK